MLFCFLSIFDAFLQIVHFPFQFLLPIRLYSETVIWLFRRFFSSQTFCVCYVFAIGVMEFRICLIPKLFLSKICEFVVLFSIRFVKNSIFCLRFDDFGSLCI
jgi:hypothetical protein